MKYWPLIQAWLWRRPARVLLTVFAVAMAFLLYGLALGESEGFRRAFAAHHVQVGQEFVQIAIAVSGAGMALVLFLTANALAQSVRLRISEFGVLKAIGFSHRHILTLVAAEAALPCLLGATFGLAGAPLLFAVLAALLPPLSMFPAPIYTLSMLAAAAVLTLFIGTASALLPALRIVRLDVVAALTGNHGGVTIPRVGGSNTRAPPGNTISTSAAASGNGLSRIVKGELHVIWQISLVTRIGLSTLPSRAKGAMVLVASVGAMVFALLSILSVAEGIRTAILDSGDPARVIVHASKTQWLQFSVLPDGIAKIAANAPGVARNRNGAPLVDSETYLSPIPFRLIKRNNGEEGGTALVGVGPLWREMTPNFHLLSGRYPHAGQKELIAGRLAQKKYSTLDSGFVTYQGARWQVVGTFTTNDWWDGYLLGDATTLKIAAQRSSDSFMLVRLRAPENFAAFRHAFLTHAPSGLAVEREPDYYVSFWNILPKVAIYIAYLLGTIIGAGAFAGTAHTMQVALEERARETAVLRALGFDGFAVAVALLLEAVLLALIGACVATAAVWLWRDGFLYQGASSVFRVTVDLHVLLVGIGWAVTVALAGALPPAIKAARQSEIEALREV